MLSSGPACRAHDRPLISLIANAAATRLKGKEMRAISPERSFPRLNHYQPLNFNRAGFTRIFLVNPTTYLTAGTLDSLFLNAGVSPLS